VVIRWSEASEELINGVSLEVLVKKVRVGMGTYLDEAIYEWHPCQRWACMRKSKSGREVVQSCIPSSVMRGVVGQLGGET
jgi:hypothetical protein